jgi:hypothetical protein
VPLERQRIIAQRQSQIDEKITRMHLDRVNLVSGLVEELIKDEALENIKLPSYISIHHGSHDSTPHVLLTHEYVIFPQAWAEPILELIVKANLYKRLAGIDE